MVREILTQWQGAGGQSGVSVMYFDDETSAATARTQLADFWTAVSAHLTEDTTWTIAQEGKTLDTASGQLTALWSDPVAYTADGIESLGPVANATQILFRWGTELIVSGRVLRGRTFVPGLVITGLGNGELEPSVFTSLALAASDFAASPSGLVVWHRPVGGAGGVSSPVTIGSVWTELAVQRGRR